MAEATDQEKEKQLYDIWSRLVHIDVHKDHGANYDESIVNGFLPYTKYQTNVFGEGSERQTISRQTLGRFMDKDSLFDSVVSGITLSNLNNTAVDASGTLSNIPGGNSYDYKVWKVAYEQRDADTQAAQIQEFMGHPFAAFVDTSNKIEKLIGALPDPLKIIYAYTAAVQNDPADKMHKLSVKSKLEPDNYQKFLSKYFLEDTTNMSKGGKSVIVYPPFDPTKPLATQIGLSHIMCKFPVFLELYKSDDPNKKGTLNTKLVYTRHDEIKEGVKREGSERTVVIHPGGNIATKKGSLSAADTDLVTISPVNTFLKKLFGMKESDIKKEANFISKHHGDIAQVLEMHRNVILTGGGSTSDMKSCFVSIDLIPIIKAFTEGIDFVFYYINSSSKLIVFKNKKLENPEERRKSLMNETKNLITSLQGELEKYINKMNEINIIRKIFYSKVKDIFTVRDTSSQGQLKNYINIIRHGFQICTLIQFIPKEEIVQETYNQVKDSLEQIQTQLSQQTPITPITPDILKTINKAKIFLQIPTSYLDLEVVFVDGKKPIADETDMTKVTLQETEIERVLVKFLGTRRNTMALKNILSTINLYKNNVENIQDLDVRTSTRLQNNWGLDFVFYIYNILKDYEDFGTLFCNSLYSVLEGDDNKRYFNMGLKITGIPEVVVAGTAAPMNNQGGGGSYSKFTYKKSKTSKNLTYKNKKVQKGGTGEPLTPEEIELIKEEIKDTEHVIELYEKFVEIVNGRKEDVEVVVAAPEGLQGAEEVAAAAAVTAREADKELEKISESGSNAESYPRPGNPTARGNNSTNTQSVDSGETANDTKAQSYQTTPARPAAARPAAASTGYESPDDSTLETIPTFPTSPTSAFRKTKGGPSKSQGDSQPGEAEDSAPSGQTQNPTYVASLGVSGGSQQGGDLSSNELSQLTGLLDSFYENLVKYETTPAIDEDIDITREDYFQCEYVHARFAANYPQFEVMKEILLRFLNNPEIDEPERGKIIDLLDRIEKLQTDDDSKPYAKGAAEAEAAVQGLQQVVKAAQEAGPMVEVETRGQQQQEAAEAALRIAGLKRPRPSGGSKTLKINKKIQKRNSNYSSQTAKHKR